MTSYSLHRSGLRWVVMDQNGRAHGTQTTREGGLQLLQIVEHMELARAGFVQWCEDAAS